MHSCRFRSRGAALRAMSRPAWWTTSRAVPRRLLRALEIGAVQLSGMTWTEWTIRKEWSRRRSG